MSYLTRLAAAALAAILLTPAAAAAAPAAEPAVFLLTVEEGREVNPALLHPRAKLLCRYALIDAVALSVPAAAAERTEQILRNLSFVKEFSRSATFLAPATEEEALPAAAPLYDAADQVRRATNVRDGEGTLIAVLDTGFDTDHPAFRMPEEVEGRITKDSFGEAVTDTYAVYRMGRETVDSLYLSPKIPFVFDYADSDGDVATKNAHGTHVAALAAASGDYPGAAPGAQLALMKVFDDKGERCEEHALILALEDAVLLGADVVNLSLGSLAIGGSLVSMNPLSRAIRAAERAGVLVVCAIGNGGRMQIGDAEPSDPTAADPDTGLPSEPAIDPSALAVAAAANAVTYEDYIEAGGRRIRYLPSHETSIGEAEPLYRVLGDETLPLCVVPGLGRAEDYAGLRARESVVLVARGEISFEEKLRHAADAGARAMIVYDPAQGDEEFLMQLGAETSIPGVSVRREDGEFLASLDGEMIRIPAAQSAFPSEDAGEISRFSSWGPTASMAPKPDITAVGDSVVSAIPGGTYGVLSGTSMATPQISAAAAVYIAAHRDALNALDAASRPYAVRAALASLAVPMTDENGLPLSPRAQGAGLIDATTSLTPSLTMEYEDGAYALSLGEQNEGILRTTVRLKNTGAEARTLSLRMPVTTERLTERDGVLYQSGMPESVPVTHSYRKKDGVTQRNGEILCTVPAGESLTVTLQATVADNVLDALKKRAENGFFLEGFVIAETADGTHAASLPFLAFVGSWSAAPALTVGDWDGQSSHWGSQTVRANDATERLLGETADGILSALFAFSPNGDRTIDGVMLHLTPLRGIETLTLEIFDASGQKMAEATEQNIPKTAREDGAILITQLALWDGSDGMNPHFIWADGAYTVRLTAYSYAGGADTLELPIRLDTVKPQLLSATVSDGTLTAEFSDDFYLRAVRAYLPDPEAKPNAPDAEKYILNETVAPVYQADTHTATVTAVLPPDVEYIYLSGEDYAGNRTVVRYYLSEEEGAA